MQRVMQNNAAVFRTQETLEEGHLYCQTSGVLYVFSRLCWPLELGA